MSAFSDFEDDAIAIGSDDSDLSELSSVTEKTCNRSKSPHVTSPPNTSEDEMAWQGSNSHQVQQKQAQMNVIKKQSIRKQTSVSSEEELEQGTSSKPAPSSQTVKKQNTTKKLVRKKVASKPVLVFPLKNSIKDGITFEALKPRSLTKGGLPYPDRSPATQQPTLRMPVSLCAFQELSSVCDCMCTRVFQFDTFSKLIVAEPPMQDFTLK